MIEERPRQQAPVERIDADAVCEQCGMVNPEDTLLCKTCGNNLRDQRLRRVRVETLSDEGPAEGLRLTFLTKVLSVAGALIIILVAINFARIEQAMTRASLGDTGDPNLFWEGANAAPFAQLARELESNPVTPQEAEFAIGRPTMDDVVDGRYVLVDRDTDDQIGQAIVRFENETYYFVAQLAKGLAEIRGYGYVEGSARIASRDKSAVQMGGQRYLASGFAQRIPDGAFECFGLSRAGNDSYAVLAYRIKSGGQEEQPVALDQNP